MKVVTTAFANQEKSVDSLSAENKVLEDTVKKLNEKLELQKKRLEEADGQLDKNSKEYQALETAVNKTQAQINTATNKIEANTKAMDNLGNETEDTSKNLDDAGKNALSFGDILKANVLSDAIIGGVKALGSAVVDLAKGMAGLVTDSAKAADEINTLSKQTGLSTDTIQKYQYAAESIDVPLDTLTGSLSKLTKTMSKAKSGNGDAAAAFESLGISVVDASGELRDNEDVFADVIAALAEIPNETERDATAMTLLGKSAQDLNPLILGGADALDELGKKAEEAGLILSSDELNDLGALQDTMDQLEATMKSAGMNIVATFAAPLSSAMDTILGYVQRLTKAFQDDGWEGLAKELGNVVDELVGFLTENIDKIGKFAEDVLTKFIDIFVENLPKLIPAAVSLLATLGTALIDHLDELIDAAIEIVSKLAFEILKQDNLQKIIDAGVDLLVALVSNTADIIAGLIAALPDIISGLITGLLSKENIEKFGEAGVKVMNAIWDGMKSVAQTIGSWIASQFTSSGSMSDFINDIAEQNGAYWNGHEFVDKVSTPTTAPGYGNDDVGQGIIGNAKGGSTIILQTPDSDILAAYATDSFLQQSKINGKPAYTPDF